MSHTPNPNQPQSYPRRVLLAVSGLSPQIVTETIYALATQTDAAIVPTEVHLITTREGAQKAELSLLSDDLGWFHRLSRDYGLSGITFNRQHIQFIRDHVERDMEDIRSPRRAHRQPQCQATSVRPAGAELQVARTA